MSIDEFHPDLRLMARLLPARTVTRRTLRVMRFTAALSGLVGPRGVEVVDLGGRASVRVHRPPKRPVPLPALLWIHGGGYVIGSAVQDDRLCKRFADALGIIVVSVDYRVAPEHPYPAAIDDCEKALCWLVAQSDVDSTRIAIGGGSAGGGLATALALRLRGEGVIQPVLQLLSYPMLDDRSACRPDPLAKQRRVLDQSMNSFCWDSYLLDAVRDDAVPARAASLEGSPPTWIGVGTLDILYDENIEYAKRLQEADVSVTLKIVRGAFHNFDGLAPKAAVSHSYFDSQCVALRRALMG